MKNFVLFGILIFTGVMSIAEVSKPTINSVTAKDDDQYKDICYFKRIYKIGDYQYANLVGDCISDLKVNGMILSLIAVSSPTDKGHKIVLGDFSNVTGVKENVGGIEIIVESETLNSEGEKEISKKMINISVKDSTNHEFRVSFVDKAK